MTVSWDDVRGALAAAPEVAQSPSMTSAVVQTAIQPQINLSGAATPPDLTGTAQGLAGAAQLNAADQVTQAHKSQGIFGHLVSAVGHAATGVWDDVPGHQQVDSAVSTAESGVATGADVAGTVMKTGLGTVAGWANWPLQQVQHTYRAFHWEFVNKGPAGALGLLLLGTDANKVWAQTQNTKVSPGRDLAGLFQLKPGSAPYNVVSGAGDATFDLAEDPIGKASAISKALTGANRSIATAGDIERVADAAKAPLASLHPSYAPVKRALNDIAATPSASRIAANYPTLKNLSPQLAQADTYDKVVDVFRNSLAAGEHVGYSSIPTFTLTRVPFRYLNDKALSWQQPKGALDDLVSNPDLGSSRTGALAAFQDRVGRTVNSFTNHTPFVMNAKNELVGHEVDPNSPAAHSALYSIMRYSQAEPVARDVADQFAAAPTVAAKAQIWNKGVLSMANAAGLPDDSPFRQRYIADMDGLTTVGGNGADTHYGFDRQGNDLSGVVAEDGSRVTAPLFTSQGGKFTIPSLTDFNTEARAVRRFGKMYGPADDFIYNNFTSRFKKLALVSAGYPIRSALSEMMTRVIGSDGVSVVHAGISAAAARVGQRLAQDEVEDIAAQLGHSADPSVLQRLVKDDDYLKTAAEIIVRHNGTLQTPAAVAAGHSALDWSGDAVGNMREDVARILMPGSKGARLDPERYVKWTAANGIESLSNVISGHLTTIARDPGARLQAQTYRDALDAGMSEDEAAAKGTAAGHVWLRDTPEGAAAQALIKRDRWSSTPGADPLLDWSAQRMAAVRGQVTNADGDTIRPLLDGIADTTDSATTHVNLHPDKVKALGLDNLPINGTPGMAIIPQAGENLIPRIVNAGYSHVITPIIQNLARTPMYVHHVQQELALARSVPGLSEDEAWDMAESRAAERMVPEIHNPLDRSQFAVAVRKVVPFFFAREQAARRVTAALHQDPFGWRKLQLAVHGMKDAGFIHTDNAGNMYFNYPLSGELGKYLPMALSKMGVNTAVGVPSGFRGDITGLAAGGDVPGTGNTSVGWSPLVSIPLKELGNAFPEIQPAVDGTIGPLDANSPAWSAFVPNASVRQAITAYAGDRSRAFVGSMVDAMQYQMAHGNMPPTNAQPGDPAWQKWIDGIRTQTRTMFAVRAVMGVGSPTSPILENGDVKMSDAYSKMIDQYGLADGTQKFLTQYPNAGAYTVFKSEGAGGVDVPETHAALSWVKSNNSFIQKNGEVGSFFIPQSQQADPDAQAVYQQEMASGLRHQKSPDEFAQQVMVQQGWNAYEADHTKFLASIAGVTDSTALAAAHHNWSQYVQNVLAPAAPLWYADYNASDVRDGKKALMVKSLVDMVDSGKTPQSPMTPLIVGLVNDYKSFQAGLANANTSNSKSQQHDNWDAYLAQQVAEHPELTTVVNRVFKGL